MSKDSEATSLASILDYLQSKPRYAILLTGDWGAGKTHFVDHVVAQAFADSSGSKKEARICYVSLSGVTDIQQLSPRLLATKFGLGDDTKPKVFGKSIELLGRWYGRLAVNYFGLPEGSVKIDLSALSPWLLARSLKGQFIVFDDLERMGLAFEEFGGYVTQLIEKQACHVLLVADETRLATKNKTYSENAEKVVGEIIEFVPDRSKIIRGICEETFHDVDGLDAVVKGMLAAIPYFEGKNQPNLRSVQAATRVLLRVKISLGEHWGPHPDLISDLSKVAIVVVAEVRRDPSIKSALERALAEPSGWTMRKAFSEVRMKQGEQSAVADGTDIVSRIMQFCYNHDPVANFSTAVLARFLSDNYLKASDVFDQLETAIAFINGKPTPIAERFLDGEFWSLTTEQLEAEAQRQLELLGTKPQAKLLQLWRVSNRLVWLSEQKLISISTHDIEKRVREKVERLADDSNLDISDTRALESHFETPTGMALRINEFLIEKSEQIERKQFESELGLMIDGGASSLSIFIEALSKKWQLMPVFDLIGTHRLFDYLFGLSPEDLRAVNSMLGSRYSSGNISEYLSKELPIIEDVAELLEKSFVATVPISPEQWMRQHVVKALRKAALQLKK